MTEQPTVPTVSELVGQLSREVTAVGKHGTAPQQQGGYSYQGIEDIVDMVHKLVRKHGLTIYSELTAHDVDSWSANGKRVESHTVNVKYAWLGPAGDRLEIGVFAGMAWDYNGDKGLNKALTAARKVMLRDHLMLSTSEDIDSESQKPPPTDERPTSDMSEERVQLLIRLRDHNQIDPRRGMTACRLAAADAKVPAPQTKWEVRDELPMAVLRAACDMLDEQNGLDRVVEAIVQEQAARAADGAS